MYTCAMLDVMTLDQDSINIITTLVLDVCNFCGDLNVRELSVSLCGYELCCGEC
jgi:hypothetical protein